MGNDIDVFQDGELEESFWRAHGPKDEAWSDMFSRCYSGFCNMLLQPKRFIYNSTDLKTMADDGCVIDVREFGIGQQPNRLHCAVWSVQHKTNKCVIYIHTNTRSLLDAKEVIPVSISLGADLLAFDLPGCGMSGGALCFTMANDLRVVVEFARDILGYTDVVVWARGMATAVAVEYAGNITRQNNPLKFIVLDSPFTSVRQMVKNGSSSVKACGITVPRAMISLSGKVIRRAVKAKLGSDPYDVIPVDTVRKISIPCFILSATNDDYIPAAHGATIATQWGCDSGSEEAVPCFRCEFNGRHFGERPESLVCIPVPEILPYLSTPVDAPTSPSPTKIAMVYPFPGLPVGGMLRAKSSLALKGLC